MLDFNTDVKAWTDCQFICTRIFRLIQNGWTHSATDVGKWAWPARAPKMEFAIFMRAPDGVLCKIDIGNLSEGYRILTGAEYDYWWRSRRRAQSFRKPVIDFQITNHAAREIQKFADDYREKHRRLWDRA